MLRKVMVEVEGSDPDVYEVTESVMLPELKCGDTGHAYVVLKLAEGSAAEPSAFTCELKFQVRVRDERNLRQYFICNAFFVNRL